MTSPTVAVLGYHKIGEPPTGTWSSWNYVSAARFRADLEMLRASGRAVLDLDTFLAGLERPADLPARSVLITFDDAYRSILEVAEPILSRSGFPSVVFVPTAFIGETNEFDAGNEPEEPICDWPHLAELERRGVAIQSHGVSHRAFSSLGEAELGGEIAASRSCLEERMVGRVETLAFPFGDPGADPSRTARLLRESGYRAAFLFRGGLVTPGAAEPFALARIPVGPDTDLASKLQQLEGDGPAGSLERS